MTDLKSSIMPSLGTDHNLLPRPVNRFRYWADPVNGVIIDLGFVTPVALGDSLPQDGVAPHTRLVISVADAKELVENLLGSINTIEASVKGGKL